MNLPVHKTSIEPDPYAGVSGWLLILCVLLTFIYPATSFYHICSHTLPMLIATHTLARVVLLSSYSAIFAAAALLSFLAGLKLWLLKPNAVRFAKRYLETYLIANFAYFFLWMILVRPAQAVSFAEMGWFHVVGPLPSFVVWYFYLENSKRVRATYPIS